MNLIHKTANHAVEDASSNLLDNLSDKIGGSDIPTFRSVGPEIYEFHSMERTF